jgi:hypothetical protein
LAQLLQTWTSLYMDTANREKKPDSIGHLRIAHSLLRPHSR